MEASGTSQPAPSEQTPHTKKNWWQAVLTATPIALTAVATVLAGLSTSEMTLAQYHRSLAAQNQSKVSDQWGFFQAKRIRGTGMEEAFDRLLPRYKTSQGMQPGRLEAASRQLTGALQKAEKQTAGLEKALTSGVPSRPINAKSADTHGASKDGTSPGSAGEPLRQAAARLHDAAQECVRQAEATDKLLHEKLANKDLGKSFAFLSGNQLPEVEDVKFEQENIQRAVQAISDRLGENELGLILRQIKEDEVSRAIETAEGNARRFESAGKSVGKMLDDIDKLVQGQTARAGDFHQAVADYRQALTGSRPGLGGKVSSDLQSQDASLEKSDAAVQAAAEELDNLFKAGRYSYTARRQKRESDYHLKTAGLYEVQVHLNSLTSDRHRTRSKLFFFCMLAAQAGVTIASLSLAVRQRNVLWALAGLAGIAAVTFSGWVYLYM
jgi:hypothetical protein